jgi:hypothetical protein
MPHPFSEVKTLLTHPGRAHSDEFLSSALLLATFANAGEQLPKLVRRNPLPHELKDPKVLVYDIGHKHEPTLHNFDHHQIAPEEKTCALSLILRYLGIYRKARLFWPWLHTAEVYDTLGPKGVATMIGLPENKFGNIRAFPASPTNDLFLADFSKVTTLDPESLLAKILVHIGQGMLKT